eukprot:jgi/Bigna1/127893/aug1.5_g2601
MVEEEEQQQQGDDDNKWKSSLSEKDTTAAASIPLLVNGTASNVINDTMIELLIRRLVEEGRARVRTVKNRIKNMGNHQDTNMQEEKMQIEDLPLMYGIEDSVYLGAAHGLIGVLMSLLSCPTGILNECTEATQFIHESLNAILKLSPSRGGGPGKEKYDFLSLLRVSDDGTASTEKLDDDVQWAHGATSLVMLFCKAYSVFGKKKAFLNEARRTANMIWHKGLVKKSAGRAGAFALFLCGTTSPMEEITGVGIGSSQSPSFNFSKEWWENVLAERKYLDVDYAALDAALAATVLFYCR